jgi:hypothetical protein
LSALVASCCLALLYYVYNFVPSPPYWSITQSTNTHLTVLLIFLERLSYLGGAALIMAAAFSAGLFFLRLLRLCTLPLIEEAVYAVGIGLGILSLATLFLGLGGYLTAAAFGPLVVIVGSLGAMNIGAFVKRLRAETVGGWSWIEKSLAAAALSGAVITVVYAFNPPLYFDALEYHLGATASYYRAGQISYIHYNVYSNFPAGGEMLYLLSMALVGSKFAGAVLGNVLNAYIALAAAAAAFCLGKWISGRAAGLFAAAALVTSAGFFSVATGYYVEPLQTLYTLLAVLAVGRFLQSGERCLLICGAASAGLAMGVKYPAAVFIAVPLALAVLMRRGTLLSRLAAFSSFTAVAILLVAPWLVKNLVFTGNPVYPLLYGIFGGRDWSALQDARWLAAHTPKGGLAWEQWARHVLTLFFSNENITLLSFIFVPFALAARPRVKRLLFVVAFAALYVLLWFAATHRIDRFALPALAVMGAASGAGLFALSRGWIRRLAAGAAVLLLSTNLLYMAAAYGHALQIDLSVPLFGAYEDYLLRKMPVYPMCAYVNEAVPPTAKVLMVGESETFYFDAAYSSTTVFDVKPLEEMIRNAPSGDPAAVAGKIKAAGFDFLFVDWATFRRQQETYAFEFEGRTVPGYSELITPAFFDSMVATGKIKKEFSAGPQVYPGVAAFALYSVK